MSYIPSSTRKGAHRTRPTRTKKVLEALAIVAVFITVAIATIVVVLLARG